MFIYVDESPAIGQLIYRDHEYSFDVEPHPPRGVSSLLINDLQIEIDEDGRLIYVWGFCPRSLWVATTLTPPDVVNKCLKYIDGKIVPGISRRINSGGQWVAFHDSLSGWLCFGDKSTHEKGIAFAPGAVAILKGGEIVALWLHPKNGVGS